MAVFISIQIFCLRSCFHSVPHMCDSGARQRGKQIESGNLHSVSFPRGFFLLASQPWFPQVQSSVLPKPGRRRFSAAPVTPDILVTEASSKIKTIKIGTHFLQIPCSTFRVCPRIGLLLSDLQCLKASSLCIISRIYSCHLQRSQYSRTLFSHSWVQRSLCLLFLFPLLFPSVLNSHGLAIGSFMCLSNNLTATSMCCI